MIGRGEHAEIIAFVGKTVDSELSGNMIDLCPVGALTSKPFRYTARTWELSRRKSVSPHDSLGTNLVVQVKQNRVMRVLPLENEEINECWLSDRDRFSYEGLNSEERLDAPMIKEGGQLARGRLAGRARARRARPVRHPVQHGPEAIGALASPHSTLEEMALRRSSCARWAATTSISACASPTSRADGKRAGAPWLGMTLAELDALDRVLVVGSFLRKDHPLLARGCGRRPRRRADLAAALRRRRSADAGRAQGDRRAVGDAARAGGDRRRRPRRRARPAPARARRDRASADGAGHRGEPRRRASARASSSATSRSSIRRPRSCMRSRRSSPADRREVRLPQRGGEFSVGGYLAGALPQRGGMNAQAMLAAAAQSVPPAARRARFRLRRSARRARARCKSAECVVALSPFRTGAAEHADVLLPIAPFTETAGTFVNCEGRVQAFNGVVKPLGEARPAWKVLRVLGSLLGLPGFEHDSIEAVRAEIAGGRSDRGEAANATGTAIGATGRSRDADRSASPTCRSISPIRSCAARPRCRRRATRCRRARANAATLGAAAARRRRRASRAPRRGRGDAQGRVDAACPTAACASPPRIRRRACWVRCSARSRSSARRMNELLAPVQDCLRARPGRRCGRWPRSSRSRFR